MPANTIVNMTPLEILLIPFRQARLILNRGLFVLNLITRQPKHARPVNVNITG